MGIKTYKMLKKTLSTDINSRENNVKEKAQKICERRKRDAKKIQNQIAKIEPQVAELKTVIGKIEDTVGFVATDACQKIKSKCNDLKNMLDRYLHTGNSLAVRLSNQKIRVLAFGEKSQGKSLFTKLYTGIEDDNIITVKQMGMDKDLTGAISIIVHKEKLLPDNPKIKVYFKKEDEILQLVNQCLRDLKPLGLCLPNTKEDGTYASWEKLMLVVQNAPDDCPNTAKAQAYEKINNLQNIETTVDFLSKTELLKSVFKAESDLSNAGQGDKIISLKDLPEYNNMQHKGIQRYMAVDHIDIGVDLQHNGMFENFEICDSKGMSVEAGGSMMNDLLYKEMNSSDAVFSIKLAGGALNASKFYQDLNNKLTSAWKGTRPENLELKHFAIVNIVNGFPDEESNVLAEQIDKLKVANCIYVGALLDGVKQEGEEIEAKTFANCVILDMLEKIAESTEQLDQKLIADCSKMAENIETTKKELKDLLEGLGEYKDYSWSTILLNSISTLAQNAIDKIVKKAKENEIGIDTFGKETKSTSGQDQSQHATQINPSDDEEEEEEDTKEANPNVADRMNNNKVKEQLENNKNITIDEKEKNRHIYKMITGVDADSDKLTLSDISVVKEALNYILENKIRPFAGSSQITPLSNIEEKDYVGKKNVLGTVHNIGEYIDNVSGRLYTLIYKNINILYGPSKTIEDIGKDELFNILWKEFKLDKLYGELPDTLKECANKNPIGIGQWKMFYEETDQTLPSDPIQPLFSFNILREYFQRMDDKNPSANETLLENKKQIVVWDILKDSIYEAYSRYEFATRVNQKLVDEKRVKDIIWKKIIGDLQAPDIEERLLPLYMEKLNENDDSLLEKAEIITAKQRELHKTSALWKELFIQKQRLSEISISKLN